MHALVVDDSSTIRKILTAYLETLGFDVSIAVNGRDGLERLKQMEKPDVVLVDWNMPEMDGLSFLRAVRATDDYAALPVMMVTTNAELSNVTEALDAGANEYLMKPFTAAMVREKLELLGFPAS
jgi:two-component system chemotaxis response regulator CheY